MKKASSKILNILIGENRVWMCLESQKEKYPKRVKYLRKILKSVLLCGQVFNGYLDYKCEECDLSHKQGFSCNQRFCSKCGYRRTEEWSEKAKTQILNVGHRHVVFTIPCILWGIFG